MMKWQLGLLCLLLTGGLFSCDDDDDDPDDECTPVGCFPVCQSNYWMPDPPPWIVREASCTPDGLCNCEESCVENLCFEYCSTEELAPGGQCDFLDCICVNSECTAEKCFSYCQEQVWTENPDPWIKREASCTELGECDCQESCDETLCDTYCQEQQGTSGGACQLFDCVCT